MKLQQASIVAKTALSVSAARAMRGPRRPGWSRHYETMVAVMRRFFLGPPGKKEDVSGDLPLEPILRAREAFDAMGRRSKGAWMGTFTADVVGGVPAVRVHPIEVRGAGRILYLHGGGYVVGSTVSHRGIYAQVALHAGAPLIGIDYRLAPEHPCPAGLHDALAAYEALLAESDAPVVIAGDSAGGGLTLATLLAIRERGLPRPAGAVLLSPWCDLRPGLAERHPDRGLDYITMRGGDRVARAYAGELARDDWRVSPLAGDLRDLPPMLVVAGADENIVLDSEQLAARARAADSPVELHVEPGEIHVYPAFAPINPRGQAAMGRIGGWIASRLGEHG